MTDWTDRPQRHVGHAGLACIEATRRLTAVLNEYHKSYPIRRGMQVDAARTALGLERALWSALAAWWRAKSIIKGDDQLIWATNHRVTLNSDWQAEGDGFPWPRLV